MNTLSFNTGFASNSYSSNDILSAFKESKERDLNIHQGMSVKEISEIVSEKIISVVKAQFEETKTQFERKENKDN